MDFIPLFSITNHSKQVLQDEVKRRFNQPFAVWWVSVVNAIAAVVQGKEPSQKRNKLSQIRKTDVHKIYVGMDETVVSGAQLFFLKYFGLENDVVLTVCKLFLSLR